MSPVWRSLPLILLTALLLASGLPAPAVAHENHVEAEVERDAANDAAASQFAPGENVIDHQAETDAAQSWPNRLTTWLGHMHPFAVHFPVALFPACWLALIVARRRGQAFDLIRALIVVAGIAAVGAAALGWLDAGAALTDRDPVRMAHRWIGTMLAGIGALLALWAWRRATSIDGRNMVWALGFVTLLVLVQGWLGAVLTHGMRHMIF